MNYRDNYKKQIQKTNKMQECTESFPAEAQAAEYAFLLPVLVEPVPVDLEHRDRLVTIKSRYK